MKDFLKIVGTVNKKSAGNIFIDDNGNKTPYPLQLPLPKVGDSIFLNQEVGVKKVVDIIYDIELLEVIILL